MKYTEEEAFEEVMKRGRRIRIRRNKIVATAMSVCTGILSVVLILDGAIMIMLGLVGEYVGRIYVTMNKSPQYVIKDEVNPIDTE